MAFPEDPLGLRVEIKAGVWTDITASVYTRDPIRHTRGIRSNGATADPASVPITINNRDGKFSPRNPMSPYYGLIGRNTPVRLWLPGGEHFLDLDGDPANIASTPDAAALDITGDLDLRIELEANWYQPTPQTLIGKWAPGQASYYMRIQDGLLSLIYSTDGGPGFFVRQRLPALPRRAALRATLDVDNGAGGFTASLYWAPSMAGPWTLLNRPYSASGVLSLFSGSAPLTIAPLDVTATATRPPVVGRVYKAEVRSGINGTVVASPDFTQQPLGTASFTDSAGRTWSHSGTAAVADRRELFVGEIASWPQKWVASHADVWTSVEAAGILRRYGQGAKALDSTLRRRIPSGSPIAYWPMEEDRYATRAYSPIKGVNPAALTNVEWASLDTLPSSKPLPKINAGAQLSAIVPAAAAGQWQVELVYNADDKAPLPTNPPVELIGISSTGTVRRWTVAMRAGAVQIRGVNAGGTEVVGVLVAVEADVFHGWVRLRLWARDTGTGSVQWRLDFQDVGGDAGGTGGTISGTAGRVTAVTGTWTEAMTGWGIGHLAVLPTAQNSLYTGSDDGYAGETAWARMMRLAGEESIPVSRIAGPLEPQLVGPQRPETLLALLQEAADADGGMLVESRDRLGLLYRDRSSLYTQEPALVLDYAAGQIAAGSLEPVDDDSATRNDVTVTRFGGSSARAVLETGPLSIQEPPDGIGVYDESVTLNLNDDLQPQFIAPWRLHLGTYDGARYPSVSVRLHRHPELIDDVIALREGDILRIVNLPSWVAYGPVDLLITGMSETYLPRTWEITLTCDPGGPWMTAQADHPVYAKANTDGTVLTLAASPSDTVLAVRVTAGPPWTTDPAEMPIPIELGGEEATVTSIASLTDNFARTVASGWGTAPGGDVWATAGGSASDRSVDGARGVVTVPSSPTTLRAQTMPGALADAEVRTRMSVDQMATGASLVSVILLRYASVADCYRARLHFSPNGELYVSVARGATALSATVKLGYAYTAGATFEVRAQVEGQIVRLRVWPTGSAEPAAWVIEQEVTASPIVEGAVGLAASAFSGNTNTAPALRFDDFEVVGVQRMTVVRSVNGVIKSHAAGTPVGLARPAIASL
ncbi:hypothetical protein ACVHNB_32930 [Streptomyces sp. YJ-C3]